MILERAALRPGDDGTAQTIAVMGRLARLGAPAMNRMFPAPATPAELRAAIDRRVTFTPDPEDAELVRAPWRTLSDGRGDCDCIATLGASVAIARGWPVRFVTVGTGPVFSHVYAEVHHDGQWQSLDLDPMERPERVRSWPVNGAPGLGYTEGQEAWAESTIQNVGAWIVSLFGGQAAARDAERVAQNAAAFRAAVAGGTADAAFLRARTGDFGRIAIGAFLPYAVSPSSGDAETPGELGGWATGPARRHAAMLYAELTGDDLPGWDPQLEADAYATARADGRDAAIGLLESVIGAVWDQIPEVYREAVERGVRDRYVSGAGDALGAAMPWVVGGGLLLALTRRGRR